MSAGRQITITILGEDKSGSKALTGLATAADQADTKVSGLGSKLGGVATTGLSLVGTAGVGAVAGIVALGGAVVKTGIDFDSMQQQAKIAFTTMLGDGGKAQDFLDNLQSFAASTPFEFPDLVSASQKLLAMGFSADQVIPTLTSIGDTVAGLGGGAEMVDTVTRAFGQMQVKGTASSEQINALVEAGIPAWQYLAQAIGTDVPTAMDMVAKGQVNAQTAISAFTTGMTGDFGGMMEQQSKSFSGLMSTLKDTFAQVSGTVMAPLFEMMTTGLQQVAGFLSSPAFTQGVTAFASGLATGFAAIGQGIQAAMPYIIAFGDALRAGFAVVGEVLGPVLATIVAQFDGLSASLAPMQGLLAALGPLWAALQGPLTIIGEILGGVLVAAIGLVLAALGGLAGYITGAMPGALQVATGAIEVFTAGIHLITDAVSGMVAIVSALLQGDWAGAWAAAQATVLAMAQDCQAAIDGMVTIVTGLFTAMIGGVQGAVSGFAATLGSYFDGIATAIGGSVQTTMQSVESGFSSMVSTVQSKVGEAVSAVQGLPGRMAGAVGDLSSILYNAGTQLIQGLINGVQAKLGELTALLGNVTSLIQEHKGPPVVDRALLYDSGRMIMEGLNRGLRTGAADTQALLGDVTATIGGSVNGSGATGTVVAPGNVSGDVAGKLDTIIGLLQHLASVNLGEVAAGQIVSTVRAIQGAAA